jgi:maltooligosyltrehalose trehalohydrolase
MSSSIVRRFSIGAEVQPGGGTHFRVWAPAPREIDLVIERDGRTCVVQLEREQGGYRSAMVAGAGAGDRYRYRLNGELTPDPASRFQPDGPFGSSQVIDPTSYRWTADRPGGVSLGGQIVYEMHVGTFTREGTWLSAAGRLPALADVGITMIEVMPVSEFPGRFGWGYDGVFPFAPTRLYGAPDDFRAFVDAAHALGLSVILDVVYNHLGPDGSVFARYSPDYFAHHTNEWGDALNFDGPCCGAVREYFSSNAAYWIDEFHLDGLRLDATQAIQDTSKVHILREIAQRARGAAADRRIVLIAENERQEVRQVMPPEDDGFGLDALWNDDFHHSAVVALTGRREAYFSDHHGCPQELISAAKYGYLFQGQRYSWQKKKRGTPTRGLGPSTFVNFIENHDQVANSGDGSRVHTRTAPGRYRAMTALFLLMPGTPMLFQGQEFGARTPFLYFADHKVELAQAVQQGRAAFVAQFLSLASPEGQSRLPAPHDPATFDRCKLDWENPAVEHVRLHRDLLAMRKADAAFGQQRAGALDGAVLGQEAFVLRYWTDEPADERILLVNLGSDIAAETFPEPLMAPPVGFPSWQTRWSSEHPDYGGLGTPPVFTDEGWRIPGQSAIVLRPLE